MRIHSDFLVLKYNFMIFSYIRLNLPSSDSNDSNDDEYSELTAERLKLEMEIDAAFSSNISDFEQDGVGDMDTKSLDRSVASSPFLETRENSNERRKLLKKRAGNKKFALNEMFQRNASKFAIFYV